VVKIQLKLSIKLFKLAVDVITVSIHTVAVFLPMKYVLESNIPSPGCFKSLKPAAVTTESG
jgi:hypothetical protein